MELMKLSTGFYIYFFSIQLVIVATILVSFWLLHKNPNRTKPYEPFNLLSPTPLPENINVKNENQLSENGYLGTYSLSIRCPKEYGIRNIRCAPSSTSIGTLNSISKNVPDINTFGAYCSYKANSGFKGTIEATCDSKLFGIPVYNASNFSPGVNSQIPDIFEIWSEEKTEKIAENQYSIKLSCPSGFSASNVMCDEYLQDISTPSELLSSEVLSEKGNFIGKCQYRSSSPTHVTIRLNCQK